VEEAMKTLFLLTLAITEHDYREVINFIGVMTLLLCIEIGVIGIVIVNQIQKLGDRE
jgi:hypothetical protein